MAILTVHSLSLSFGEVPVLQNVSFQLQKAQRVGLVGVNGSGKTSLFKTLTGEYAPDAGSITFGKDTVLGYMEQHVCRNQRISAFEEVLSVFAPLLRMERELEDLSALLESAPAGEELQALIQRQSDRRERFQEAGGLTFRSRVKSTLAGLGFAPEQMDQPVGVLSGGQKAKLQLAKMLLSGANLLLLDEPTNHLDIQAVEWLEGFLAAYPGAYIVISHDRYFLDKVTELTLELEACRLTSYKGNYSRYLELRQEHRLAQQRVYESTQREIQRIEGIIEQQRRWNQERNYVTIASKQKQIDRLAATLEKPPKSRTPSGSSSTQAAGAGTRCSPPRGSPSPLGGPSCLRTWIWRSRRGEKVFLIGPNGCGKTSLFKILLGQYAPDTGFVRPGRRPGPGVLRAVPAEPAR